MASKQGVGVVLAYLHELFPTREITPTTGTAWLLAFHEVPDDILMDAAQKCGRDSDRKFFPTAGEVRAQMPKPVLAAQLSADEVLSEIERLGGYGPQFQWVWPRVEMVRAQLGGAIATAYGNVGPHRLNSDNPTTREIAARDFSEGLIRERAEDPERLALPVDHPRLRVGS